MKKAIQSVFIGLTAGFFSCVKPHSCECSTTVTFPGTPAYRSSTTEPISQKTSDKQAAAICRATQAQLEDHLKEQLTDPNVTVTSSAECTVK